MDKIWGRKINVMDKIWGRKINVMDKIWGRKSFEVGGHWQLWRG